MGERYAIDFVGVGVGRRTADRRDWRTLLDTEPVDRFYAFGRPVLAPADGTVVDVLDGEIDHEARRSQLALVPYMAMQRARLRQGIPAIAGNHIIIALADRDALVAIVHLRAGSVDVAVGDGVTTGQPIAECGNSGNSTQPHVHLQVMDSRDLSVARGVPMAFRGYREWRRGATRPQVVHIGIPQEDAVIEPL